MRIVGYNNIHDLVNEITVKYIFSDTLYDIAVYGKFNIIKELFEKLIAMGYHIDSVIDLSCSSMSNYDKEYVLYINDEGINICKLWHEENEYNDSGYYYSSGDICYVHGDCSSNLISKIDGNKIIEFALYDFGDDKCCDENCSCDCRCWNK